MVLIFCCISPSVVAVSQPTSQLASEGRGNLIKERRFEDASLLPSRKDAPLIMSKELVLRTTLDDDFLRAMKSPGDIATMQPFWGFSVHKLPCRDILK
ncbi:hypothetical protein TrRE_jg3460 [Triparma retinervis]|uniref:Uncharacterized protein n=1 Tax=Triparma retinervis TaxID=2557542 RepID=A0A9W7L3S2_9STRA|nr:hypothetical protein TrRE_jg3460 [Triparma retinervis]